MAVALTFVALPAAAVAVPCTPENTSGPAFSATASPTGGIDFRVRFTTPTSGGGASPPRVTLLPGEVRVEQEVSAGILLTPGCFVETLHVDVPAGTYNVTWRVNAADFDFTPIGVLVTYSGVVQSNHYPNVPTLDWRGIALLIASVVSVALFLLRR